jgi:transposase
MKNQTRHKSTASKLSLLRQLPPCRPELNTTERIWNYARKHATHNRFFEKPNPLCRALFRTFDHVQCHP